MKMENRNPNLDNEPFFTEGELEVRSAEGGKTVVYGYAALFNVRSRTLTTKKGVKFVEEIKPGAFDSTDFSDAVCFFNHEGRDFLAAIPNLRYGVDQRGLWYEYDHDPADPTHVSALRRIQRRDAKGSSFQFLPLPSDCYTITKDGEMPVRTITRFPMVAELGPVITPAYRGTTTHARSLGIDDVELNGTVVEGNGISLEPRGIVVEAGGTPVEPAGNPTEEQQNAVELLEKRKLQVRATLM